MAKGEFVGSQLPLASLNFDPVPRFAEGDPGSPYIHLSQSRAELIVKAWNGQRSDVLDPRIIPLEQHMVILRGNALHEIIQLLELWWRISPPLEESRSSSGHQYQRPFAIRDYRDQYARNLDNLGTFLPTTSPQTVRRIQNQLSDIEQLMLPRSRRENYNRERQSIYKIIATKALNNFEHQPPFVETESIQELDELYPDFPFPHPTITWEAWQRTQSRQQVLSLMDSVHAYHMSCVIIPGTVPRKSGTEFRFGVVDHAERVTFSGRLDAVYSSVDQDGHPMMQIIDYKSSLPVIPKHGHAKDAFDLSVYYLLQAVSRLQDRDFDPTSTRIIINLFDPQRYPRSGVAIDYRGFTPQAYKAEPVTRVSLHRLPQYINQRAQRFLEKVKEQRERLKPILQPKKR